MLLRHETIDDTRSPLGYINSMLVQGVRTTLKGHELVLRGLGGQLISLGALDEPERGRALIERMREIGKTTAADIHDPVELEHRATELSKELDEAIAPGFEVLVAKARRGQPEERDWTCVRKNGTRFPARLSVTALYDPQGEIIGFMGISADLSEQQMMRENLRDSEARYRTLFEGVGDAIFVVEGDRFRDCNPASLVMFGCTREQILEAAPYEYSPALQPDGRSSKEKAMEKIQAVLDGNNQVFEWLHRRQDGTPFDAEVSLDAVEIGGRPYLHGFDEEQRRLGARILDISHRSRRRRHVSRTTCPLGSLLTHLRQQAVDRNEHLLAAHPRRIRGQALCFAPSARAISRLTRDTDNPSSRAIALMLSALSVWALYSASSRFSQLASHRASVRDLRR